MTMTVILRYFTEFGSNYVSARSYRLTLSATKNAVQINNSAIAYMISADILREY